MKRYINTALLYAIFAMAGGVLGFTCYFPAICFSCCSMIVKQYRL